MDLRDLWRPGSGMTPRRLLVLLKALPPDAPLWAAIDAAAREAARAKPDEIRNRQAAWEARNAAARAKEEGGR